MIMETVSGAVFRQLARNNLWSNYRLHAACARLSEADYVARRPAFFGSIHGTLNHILQIDRLYFERLAERRPEAPPYGEEQAPDLALLTVAQQALDRQLIALVEGFDEAALAAPVSWVSRGGQETANPRHAVLLHLFLHQVHHRGQVHDMLAQTDVPPPQLDEFFLEEDAARRAADLEALDLS